MEARRSEEGVAIAFVTLVALGLFALAHGLLYMTLGELRASAAGQRVLESRAAALAATSLALGSPPGRWMDSLALWDLHRVDSTRLGRADARGSLRRLAAEAWLIEGEGSVNGRSRTRTGRLAWSLDPLERVRRLAGVVTVGPGAPVGVAGTIDAGQPNAVEPPLEDTACEPWLAELTAHYLHRPLWPVATLPDSAPPSLGLIGFDSLLASASVTVGGSGTPKPVEGVGQCLVDEPWNWGDPERPWRPCGHHLPMRGSPADIVTVGGAGQGVLIVDGDASLTAGARFYGVLIVSGALDVSGGSSLHGFAIAGAGVHVAHDSRMKGSACWAVRALDAQRTELGAFRLLDGATRVGPL